MTMKSAGFWPLRKPGIKPRCNDFGSYRLTTSGRGQRIVTHACEMICDAFKEGK